MKRVKLPENPIREEQQKTLELDEAELLQLGVIARPHGVRGEVRVHLFNPESATIWEVEELIIKRPYRHQFEIFEILNIRRHNKGPLLAL